MMRRLVVSFLSVVAMASGCSERPADDRTMDALETERARASKEDPNSRLANLAAGRKHTAVKEYAVSPPSQKVGGVNVKPTYVRISKSVDNGKLAITTEDRFLLVTVATPRGEPLPELNYETASLADTAGNAWSVARDAQRLVRQPTVPAAPAPSPTQERPEPPPAPEAEQEGGDEEAAKAQAEAAEEKVAVSRPSEIVLVFEIPETVKERNLSLNLESAAFKLR